MDWSRLPEAVIALIFALALFVRSRSTAKQLDEIHVAVNSHLSDVVRDLRALAGYISSNAKPGDPQPPQLESSAVVPQPVVPEVPPEVPPKVSP